MLQHEEMIKRLVWAEEIVRTAGRMMREYAQSGDMEVSLKLNKTEVTRADQDINDMLITRVAQDYPEDGVLGEEASAHADRSLLWVFDPIDDTKGYIQDEATAMSSLALVQDGETVVAAMYEPIRDRLFTAIKGGGSFMNGKPIHVSDQISFEGAQIAVSPSVSQTLSSQGLYSSIAKAGAKLLLVSGEAYRGGKTANGMIDAHLFPGRSAHDVAAVKLIVEEAGGKVTDLRGGGQPYNREIYGAIVSNGHLHERLVSLLQEFDAENFIGY